MMKVDDVPMCEYLCAYIICALPFTAPLRLQLSTTLPMSPMREPAHERGEVARAVERDS